ncbi:MAG: alpha/beta hydrolase-fold protein [Sphaerochaetaceae bacterium]
MLQVFKTKTSTIDEDITFRVFTPDSYKKGNSHYPVLYIMDGQNIFMDEDSVDGKSWNFSDYYEKYHAFLPEVIIVGIDCPLDNERRTALYIPFTKDFSNNESENYHAKVEGKGKQYLLVIIEELKPWIDSNFRTIPSARYTAIGGDSSAGVLSLYAIVKYPQVFSRFLSLSGAFYHWFDALEKEIDYSDFNFAYCYFDYGGKDCGRITSAEQFSKGNARLYDKLISHGFGDEQILYKGFPMDTHSNYCFGRRFPDALRWIFQDCMNSK